jgi:hypothetical protein
MKCWGLFVVFHNQRAKQEGRPMFFVGPVDLNNVQEVEAKRESLNRVGWPDELLDLRCLLDPDKTAMPTALPE